jgi:hypothetical protein
MAKKLISIRLEEVIIQAADKKRDGTNRSLSNMIETILAQSLGVKVNKKKP